MFVLKSDSPSMKRKYFIADPKYSSILLSKFINMIMFDGEKAVARSIVYKVLDEFAVKIVEKYPGQTFNDSFLSLILDVAPSLVVKKKRIGGSNYQVPVEPSAKKKCYLGMKLIIDSAREKKGMSFVEKLRIEISDILENKGNALKARDNITKMATANKVYSNLI